MAMSLASAARASLASKQASDITKTKIGDIEAQKNFNQELFEKQYYDDITNRSEIQQLLKEADERDKRQQRQNRATSAIMGSTAEQDLAAQDSINKGRADLLAEIAGNASKLKDGYLTNWQNQMNNYYASKLGMTDQLAAIETNKSNQWANTAANAAQAAGSMLGAGFGQMKSAGANRTWEMAQNDPDIIAAQNDFFNGVGKVVQ